MNCFFSGLGYGGCCGFAGFYVSCGYGNLVVCDCSVLIMCWLGIVFGFVCGS